MFIKQITWQHRNDFSAIMQCEQCGIEANNPCGYNDVYYHTRVIPEMKCGSCGKSRIDIEKENIEQTKEELRQ